MRCEAAADPSARQAIKLNQPGRRRSAAAERVPQRVGRCLREVGFIIQSLQLQSKRMVLTLQALGVAADLGLQGAARCQHEVGLRRVHVYKP